MRKNNETLVTCDGCGYEVATSDTALLSDNTTRICIDCLKKTDKEDPREQE